MPQARLDTMRPGHPFVGRIDPYTRTPFVLNERFVVCGGNCGRAYKLVTCEHFAYRCPVDSASLQINTSQPRPIRITKRHLPLGVRSHAPRPVRTQTAASLPTVAAAGNTSSSPQPQPSPLEEVFVALFGALSWLRNRGLPALGAVLIAAIEWVEENGPVARQWVRQTALPQARTVVGQVRAGIEKFGRWIGPFLTGGASRVRSAAGALLGSARSAAQSIGQKIRVLRQRFPRKRTSEVVLSPAQSVAPPRENVMRHPLVAAAIGTGGGAALAAFVAVHPQYLQPVLDSMQEISGYASGVATKIFAFMAELPAFSAYLASQFDPLLKFPVVLTVASALAILAILFVVGLVRQSRGQGAERRSVKAISARG